MSNTDNRKFQIRKAHSTYSLPGRMYQTSRNDCLNEMKCNNMTSNYSVASNHSLSLKSAVSASSCKGSNSFIAKYKDNCKAMNSQPLSLVKVQFSDVFLDLIVDRIRLPDWIAILRTISQDKSLHFISFRSKIRGHAIQEHMNTEKKALQANKESVLYTRYLINKISESLGQCLTCSKSFLCLQLQRIPLRGKGIQILGEGLKKTQSLQHLSLQYCDVGDEGCLILSQSLRNVPTLITIDLSFCNISAFGAKYISDLIKFQEIARLGECWKQSLRYREVDHDQIKGLRRITLNDNPDIGDVGLQYITDVLMDDFWVRALDMQNCGITEDGATLVRKLIEINNEIGVIDLRRNSHLKNATVAHIIKTLSKNITEHKAEYVWLHLTDHNTDNTMPSGSTLKNVSKCENRLWNRNPGNKINLKLSTMSSCSETAQLSINKVEKWKKSSQNIFDKTYEENVKNCKTRKSDASVSDRCDEKESTDESHLSDTASSKYCTTNHNEKSSSDIYVKEPEKVNEITKDIKDIFYDFIKYSSTKNREIKFKQYPNVNYLSRKYESDSDSD